MERSDIDTLKTQMSRVLHELNEQEKRIVVLEKKDERVRVENNGDEYDTLIVDDIFSFRRIILKQGDFNIKIESEQYDHDVDEYHVYFYKSGEELHSVTHYNKGK